MTETCENDLYISIGISNLHMTIVIDIQLLWSMKKEKKSKSHWRDWNLFDRCSM